MPFTDKIAEIVASMNYDDLSVATRACAKVLFIDTLAASIAARDEAVVAVARDVVLDGGGNSQSLLWGTCHRVGAADAAFVNGIAATVLDYDSVHLRGRAHAAAVALPACFAVAEKTHATGVDFLTAFVAGTELICRLGLSAQTQPGWFYTSLFGIFGAAAASARLLGLDKGQIRNALGIAYGHTSGTQQSAVEQVETKFILSASSARSGVHSALLAQRGVRGPHLAFEGRFGLSELYTPVDFDVALKNFGSEFLLNSTILKKYPCCACSHSAIDAALQYRQMGHAIQHLEDITVVLSPYAARLVGADYDPRSNARVAAQFSVRYAVACALLRGSFRLSDIEPRSANAPDVVRLAQSIKVVVDDERAETAIMDVDLVFKRGASGPITIPGKDPFHVVSSKAGAVWARNKLRRALAPEGDADPSVEDLLSSCDRLEEVDDMRIFADRIAALSFPCHHDRI